MKFRQLNLVIIVLAASLANAKSAKNNYQNFSLPLSIEKRLPEAGSATQYHAKHLELKTKGSFRTPSLNPQRYLFAREAFLSEKREEAIKALRQQMDSGLKANEDNMLLRLGQLYAEKYMELSYLENELYTSQLEDFEKKKATDKNAKTPKLQNARSQKYLKDALTLFYKMERTYKNHPKLDEILFFIGFVEMESGNNKKGSGYLERLIKQYPKSRKYDEAMVYLADYYFDHQQFSVANQKYAFLLKNQESGLYHYGVYKTAWCELNLHQERKALSRIKKLIEDLKGSQDKAKFNLREQAIKDAGVFFVEAGEVDGAAAFYEEHMGREKMVENLKLIADMLRSKARDQAALQAYERILQENPDSIEAPSIALSIYESEVRMGKTDSAVKHLVDAVEKYNPGSSWASKNGKEKTEVVLKAFQIEISKAAYFYHSAAQKSANKPLYKHADNLYSALLTNFPNHPEKKKILFYRAEILYQQKKWLEATEAYLAVSKLEPKDKLSDEAVYNALLSLDNVTAKQEKLDRLEAKKGEKIDLSPKDIPDSEMRFINVAEIYLNDYPKGEKVVDVKFRVGAIYYRYRHFDKAIAAFDGIATTYPKHRSAETAAGLVLDIYNVQKDYAQLEKTANRYEAIATLGDKEFRKELARVRSEIQFKRIESFEAGNEWAKAADEYWKAYSNNPQGPLAEQSLYNAYVSYEKADNFIRATEIGKLFAAKFPKSTHTASMLLKAAKQNEEHYEFDKAEVLYAEYHQKFPKEKEAMKALYNSALFAELLDKGSVAIKRYDEYIKQYKISNAEKDAIALSVAKIYRKQGEWDKYQAQMRKLSRESGNVDTKLKLLGELARNLEIANRDADKNAIAQEIRGLYQTSKRPLNSIGLAAKYVAEGEFKLLASKREKYNKVVLRFPPEDLVYLMGVKQKQLAKLAEDYDRVVELGVPTWGVAALHEKASSYMDYVKQFRALEIPKKHKGEEKAEIEKSLKQIDETKIKPLEKKGQEFYEVCAAKAAEFYVVSGYASQCRSKSKDFKTESLGIQPQAIAWSRGRNL